MMTLSLFLGESTNPFNLMRQMMDIEGRQLEAKHMGTAFISLFLVVRVILCPILCAWVNGSNCDS